MKMSSVAITHHLNGFNTLADLPKDQSVPIQGMYKKWRGTVGNCWWSRLGMNI